MVSAGAQLVRTAHEGNGQEVDSELDSVREHVLRGESLVARAFLRRLRERKWDAFSSRQRWRLCTIEAELDIRDHRLEDAARLLIEGREHQPDEAGALVNEVLAHELLGDGARAQVLAQQARSRFPNSGLIYGACVRTAHNDAAYAALLVEIPAQLARSPQVWGDAAVRAQHLESPTLAEDSARRATTLAGDDLRTWFALGTILLRTEADKVDPTRPPQENRPDQARLAEAESCFSRTVSLAGTGNPHYVAGALMRRAATRGVRGQLQGAQADIDEAFRLAPKDPVVMAEYARLLGERGNTDASIRMLREVIAQDPAHEARFVLGVALCTRNLEGDRLEGARLFRECASQGGENAASALMYAVQAFISITMYENAAAVLDAVPRADEALVATLRAWIALEGKNEDEANAQGTRALGLIGSSTSRETLQRLGKILATLKRFRDSLEVWKRVALAGGSSDDTRWLVETAVKCGEDALVLKVAREARSRSDFDPYLIAAELRLLDRYDPNEAATVLRAALTRKPDDKVARLTLALLSLRLPTTELGSPPLTELPDVRDVRPEEGAGVVHLLLQAGRKVEARGYAYDLLRRHFSSVIANRAFWHTMLPTDGHEDASAVDLDTATAGAAVCFVERGASQRRWIVLEDSSVEAGDVPEEIRLGTALWTAFEGKKVGETVVLAAGPGRDRTATVDAVVSKYVHRAREVMDTWQLRFPDEKEIWMMPVATADGQFDIEPFIKLVEETNARTKEAEDLYRTKMLSVWLFGRVLGRDEIHAAMHLAAAEGQVVRCCVGSEAEEREAAAAFDTAEEVVIDQTAIATLLLLDRIDVLDKLGKQVVISHGTFTTLQALLRDAKSRERSVAAFGTSATGEPAILTSSEEHKKSSVNAAERLIKLACTRWRVEGCLPLAELESARRDLLLNGFGEAAVQSAVIAAAPSRVLWTDDAIVAALAKEQFGARRIWTQSLLRRLLASRAIDESTYTNTSSGLVALRYNFTSVTPEVLRRAAQRADWVPDRYPMPAVLDYLTAPQTRMEDAAVLAAGIAAFAYRDLVLVEKRRATLIAIAEAVGRRTDASRALPLMQASLGRSFGLDVLGAADAARTFAAWRVAFNSRLRGA